VLRRLGLGLIVVVWLLAACDPEPEPPPPPPPTGTVVVYGDSLVVESVAVLYERFPVFVPNTNLVVRAYGGTAQCDFHDQMTADADELDVVAVVIAFSGNHITPCIEDRPYVEGYTADAEWAAALWADHDVPVVFVASLGALESSVEDQPIAAVYESVAAAYGAALADPAPLFARGAPSMYASRMPCLTGECFGSIEVRRADGHLCHEPTDGLSCPDYSSGVTRYVDVMLRAVGQRLDLAEPPPLGAETAVFWTR